MWDAGCIRMQGRVSGAGVVFLRRFPLGSSTFSIHEKSSMFSFPQKIDFRKEKFGLIISRRITKKKKKSSKTMIMSVGHCTQRKPGLWGQPCLAVMFVSELLVHWSCFVAPKLHDAKVQKREGVGDCKNHRFDSSPSSKIRPHPFATAKAFLFFFHFPVTGTGTSWSTSEVQPGTFPHVCRSLFFYYMLFVSASWSHLTFTWVIKQTTQFPRGVVFDDRW